MKPWTLERVTFDFNGVPITVKELLLCGNKREERYFIYVKGFTNCGGYGWKDIVQMYSRFRAFHSTPAFDQPTKRV